MNFLDDGFVIKNWNKKQMKGKVNKTLKAFSIVEMSISILVIGILIAGIVRSTRLVEVYRLQIIRSSIVSSPVNSIPNLKMWINAASKETYGDVEYENGQVVPSVANNVVLRDINKHSPKINAVSAGSNPAYKLSPSSRLPSLYFDGISNYLNIDPALISGTEYTVFVVEVPSKTAESSSSYFIGSAGSCGTNNCFAFGYQLGSSPKIRISHGNNDLETTSVNIPALSSYVLDRPVIHEAILGSAGRKYYRNGVEGNGDSNKNKISLPTSLTIGRHNDSFYGGYINEIIVFDRSLNEDERLDVEKYLAKAWGVTLSADTSSGASPTPTTTTDSTPATTTDPTPTVTADPAPAPAPISGNTQCYVIDNVGVKNVTITAPSGATFKSVVYADFGTGFTNGACTTVGSCNSSKAITVVNSKCVGKTTCLLDYWNDFRTPLGDPCVGVVKKIQVKLSYSN